MRPINSFEDVRQQLVEVENKLSLLSNRSVDFHGRRITNAGDAQDPQDYITQSQLEEKFKGIIAGPAGAPGSPGPPGTNAERNDWVVAYCTGTLTCGFASFADVSGCNILLDKIGVYVIFGVFNVSLTQTAGLFSGRLAIDDGSTDIVQAGLVNLSCATANAADGLQATVSGVWIYQNPDSTFRAKLQGLKGINAGTALVNIDHSTITAVYLRA